jgi:hypothetical protein
MLNVGSKELAELEDKILDKAIEAGFIRVKGAKAILDGGIEVTKSSFLGSVFNERALVRVDEKDQLPKETKQALEFVWIVLQRASKEHDKIEKEEKVAEILKKVSISGNYMESILKYLPILVLEKTESKEGIVFINPETRKIHKQVNLKIYSAITGTPSTEIMSIASVAHLCFNPMLPDLVYPNELGEDCVNLYSPPDWRYVVPGKVEIPAQFQRLFNHLFTAEKEVTQYVLAWMARAIMGRNNTILTLVGAKGIGKNILVSILMALIGRDYSATVGNSILDDKFNASMEDNRLLFLDEIVAQTEEHMSKLKSYINDIIPLEKKGVDATSIKNYNSIVLACNVMENIMLQSDDRRYSVPELTSIPLKSVMTEGEILSLVKEIENPKSEMISSFGHWLLENYVDLDKQHPDHTPWKQSAFYKIAESNMREWQIFLEGYAKTSGIKRIPLNNVSKEFRKKYRESKINFPTKTSTLSNFIKSHLVYGRYRIGTIERGDKALDELPTHNYLVIDDELWKSTMDTREILDEEDGSLL